MHQHARNPSASKPSSKPANGKIPWRFAAVPLDVVDVAQTRRFSARAHRVLWWLIGKTLAVHSTRVQDPATYSAIASGTGIQIRGERSVSRAVRELSDAGIVTVTRKPGRAAVVSFTVSLSDTVSDTLSAYGVEVMPERHQAGTASGRNGNGGDAETASGVMPERHQGVMPERQRVRDVNTSTPPTTASPESFLESFLESKHIEMSAPSASPEVEPRDTSPRPTDETSRSEPAETRQGTLIPDAEPKTRKTPKTDKRLAEVHEKAERLRTAWNEIASRLGVVRKTKPARGKLAHAAARQVDDGLLEDMDDLYEALKDNPWHCGRNDQAWKADFAWLCRDEGKAQQLLDKWRAGRDPDRPDGPNVWPRPQPPPDGCPQDVWDGYYERLANWEDRERRFPSPWNVYA
jgi:hypothetical protein